MSKITYNKSTDEKKSKKQIEARVEKITRDTSPEIGLSFAEVKTRIESVVEYERNRNRDKIEDLTSQVVELVDRVMDLEKELLTKNIELSNKKEQIVILSDVLETERTRLDSFAKGIKEVSDKPEFDRPQINESVFINPMGEDNFVESHIIPEKVIGGDVATDLDKLRKLVKKG